MKTYFDTAKNSGVYWEIISFDYHCATTTLQDKMLQDPIENIVLYKPFLLNAAISLELLIKACYIESKLHEEINNQCNKLASLVVNDDLINFDIDHIFNHDLFKILQQTLLTRKNSLLLIDQFEINEDEKTILNSFREVLLWGGKYPIPKNKIGYEAYAENLEPYSCLQKNSVFSPKAEQQLNFLNYKNLYEKIRAFYKEECMLPFV